ncbi:MAG: T9SS type A sorting domain-containing protein [Bacteroidetes bacterium]|nr:T9SS type A sorting domain-containing protein [Bacteroidota bacterium]
MLYVLTFGLLCNVAYATDQAGPDYPILGFGVREGGSAYPTNGDINLSSGWWPDNRIWTVPSRVIEGEPQWKEVLVPVFISNRWYNFRTARNPNGLPSTKFQEISSFAFKVYYDDRTLEFVDIQKHHPYTAEEARNLRTTRYHREGELNYYTPLAYNFNVTAANNKANDYYRYFDMFDTTIDMSGVPSYKHAGVGGVVTVSATASSFHNLDTTRNGETKVLLYLKFRVKATTVTTVNDVRTCWLYFDPTYIYYNGINIAKDRVTSLLETFPSTSNIAEYNVFSEGFVRVISAYTRVNDNMQYFNPDWDGTTRSQQVDAIVGLQQYSNYRDLGKYTTDPYLPGSIMCRVMSNYNEFQFEIEDRNSRLETVNRIVRDMDDPSLWRMTEPITADNLVARTTAYLNRSERGIIVTTTMNYPATMEDIVVETDQNWLRVRATPHNTQLIGDENKFGNAVSNNNPVRRAYALRINNLIDPTGFYDPFPNTAVNQPGVFRLWVDCDQTDLEPGEYTGTVTFKSPFDRYEATKIEIKFIVLASPVERPIGTPVVNPANPIYPFGIMLKVTPFNGTRTDLTRTLIMGSAPLATDLVDSLYGEFARTNPLGSDMFGNNLQFDARFFLDTTAFSPEELAVMNSVEKNNLVEFGYGDYTHHDGLVNTNATDNKIARSHSRDIRSSISGSHSHLHYVKYSWRGTDDFYPVVLEWDAAQFNPQVNTIHLKYIFNGQTYVRDMRSEGTPIGGTRYTFTFTDKSVDYFWIEYTIGEESMYSLLDNFGDPIIMPYAWNLLSLPLDPVNKFYRYVYPNSMNIPLFYFNGGWQQAVDGNLKRGMGYFIKYNAITDTVFNGASFNMIRHALGDEIELYAGNNPGLGGWNAVGAVSKITSINSILFDEFNGSTADVQYTLFHGVWGYRPNQGYVEVSALYPGKGYFFKVDRNSYYSLIAAKTVFDDLPAKLTNKVAGFDKITVADANQKAANLYAANNIDVKNYQLPPLPPEELFDVRFSKDNYATNYETSIVNMQGITYPVLVNFDNPRANYSVIDPVSGDIYGNIKAGETKNITINYSKSNSFKLVAEASNETFFVAVNNNPVVTNTAEVSFGVDNNANVSLSIFNTLGIEVANITEEVNKSIHNRTFDVTNLPAGAYTVRLLANGEARVFMMNIVK